MRVPICNADLPLGFNKLAKYIGRHWPDGRLKLSQSRERLAKMLGYSSAYAVLRELVPEESVHALERADIVQIVCANTDPGWNVDPAAFAALMQRLPWHDIKAGRSDVNGNR